MPVIHNPYDTNHLRRELRRTMTKPEIILWSYLKHRQFLGYKFRRQHGIGRYIVDFYCPALRLAIEVDGGQHFEDDQREYDETRTNILQGLNIQVVRFANIDILQHIDGVLFALDEIVQDRRGSIS